MTATAFVGDGSGITNVGAAALATGSVGSDELINGDVQLIDLDTDSVNSVKIVDGSVSLIDMNTASVNSDKLVDGSVSLIDMNTASVNSDKIVDNSITSADILLDTIQNIDIATDAVRADEIQAGAVGTSEIADGTVALIDMDADSVNSSKIVDGSVELADLDADSVNSSKIVDGSVTASDLADDYVNVSGDFMTGALTMNAQNEVRFADSAGGEYVAFRAPATVSSNVLWTLPDDDAPTPTPSNWVLSSNGSGTLSWAPPSAPADNLGNHSAGLNVQLNSFWLSGDGGNEGLQIDASGNVTLSGTVAGNGSLLTNVGSSAIADGSVSVGDLNTASVDGRYLRGDTNDTMSGSLTATSFISTSDRRLKKNIKTLDGLDIILNMRGVSFDWRSNGEREIGLIAQEVEAVLPDLVVTNPETGIKAVKYANIVSPLIESTKDLYGMCEANAEDMEKIEEIVNSNSRRIASLEQENAELKAQNEEQDKKIQQLMSDMAKIKELLSK